MERFHNSVLFQSLTGRLQTALEAEGRLEPARFQSLTGRLQTAGSVLEDRQVVQFQSLTGRLQTVCVGSASKSVIGFNPSQVGYKHHRHRTVHRRNQSFNPSQVGYKRQASIPARSSSSRFQSLTGRLQTFLCQFYFLQCEQFQSLTGRLQTNPSSGQAPTPARQRHSL